MTDIVARLRDVPEILRWYGDLGDGRVVSAGILEEAAAEIERLRRVEAIAQIMDSHLGEDDRMWSDDSTISTEWIGSDGVRRSLTFGLFRQLREALTAHSAYVGEG